MDTALIGILPVKILKNLSHAFGNVAVGQAVGNNVRQVQSKTELPLERIQLRCLLNESTRFKDKLILQSMYKLKKPILFLSRIAVLPLCLIDSLTFSSSSNSKSLDGIASIEFTITLVEFRIKTFIKVGSKFAWLKWTTALLPDRSTGEKLYTTAPNAEQEPAKIVSDYISSTLIKSFTSEDFNNEISDTDLYNVNIINKRFSKIPIENNKVFPQTIKLSYPPSPTYYTEFNTVNGFLVPPGSEGIYSFPTYNVSQVKEIIIKLIPKMINGIIYITMVVYIDGIIFFERKINKNIIYTIGIYEFTFNHLDIKEENIQPENQEGGIYGTNIEGGLRIK